MYQILYLGKSDRIRQHSDSNSSHAQVCLCLSVQLLRLRSGGSVVVSSVLVGLDKCLCAMMWTLVESWLSNRFISTVPTMMSPRYSDRQTVVVVVVDR